MAKGVVKILIMALVLRVLIAPFSAHLWDLSALQEGLYYTVSGENIYRVVYQKTLQARSSTNMSLFYEGYAYPPHIIYILLPFYLLYLLLGADPRPIEVESFVSTIDLLKYTLSLDFFLFSFMIKIPMILADLAIIYILYGIDRRLSAIYAFSPYSITIGSAWGMFDALVGLFLLISIILKDRPFLAGLALGLSLVKPYAVVAVLPLLIYMYSERGREGALLLLAGLFTSQIPTLLYFISSPLEFLYVVIFFHALRPPSGLTPLRVLSLAESPSVISLLSVLHTAIVISLYLFLLKQLAARKAGPLESTVSSLSMFLSLSKVVHQQYFASLFPLLLLCSVRRAIVAEILFFIYTTVTVLPFLFAPTFLFVAAYVIMGSEILALVEAVAEGWRSLSPLAWFPLSILSFLFFLKVAWDIARGNARCSSSIYK